MAFPTTGLVANVTAHKEYGIDYVWNGKAWEAVTDVLPSDAKGFLRNDKGDGVLSWAEPIYPKATEAKRGIIQLATSTEAAAGNDQIKAVTPKSLKYWFSHHSTATTTGTGMAGKMVILGADGKLDATLAVQGVDGKPGAAGAPGAKGDKGNPGGKGDKGDKGTSGISPALATAMDKKITANKTDVAKLKLKKHYKMVLSGHTLTITSD